MSRVDVALIRCVGGGDVACRRCRRQWIVWLLGRTGPDGNRHLPRGVVLVCGDRLICEEHLRESFLHRGVVGRGLHVHHDHGDVVATAPLVCGLHQPFGGGLRVGVTCQNSGDLIA